MHAHTHTPSLSPFTHARSLYGLKSKPFVSSQELDRQLPILRPDFDLLSKPPERGIRTTWIGHATVLIQMEGASVLMDPVFSERCSPSQWFGPKRFRSAACQVDELPEINAVLISHNHYDHLDANSVRTLNDRFGPRLRWYVPLGLKSWMRDMSCDNVVELDWWEEDVIPDVPDVKIAFVPSCHWTKRTPRNEYKVFLVKKSTLMFICLYNRDYIYLYVIFRGYILAYLPRPARRFLPSFTSLYQ